MNPSARQRKDLHRTMKQFAFDESPMFRHNHIQEMSAKREFVFFEQPDVPENYHELTWDRQERYASERTVIELGFRAVRVRQHGGVPAYCYEVRSQVARSLTSREAVGRLSQDTQDDLFVLFTQNDVDFDEEDASDMAEKSRKDRRDELVDELEENGIECEQYQSEMLSFTTFEETIESSYEHGYLVDSVPQDVKNSHSIMYEEYDDPQYCETADGTYWIADRDNGNDGSLSIADEIEMIDQFEEIVEMIDEERVSIDFLSFDDKLAKVLYIVECLKKKVLIDRLPD